MDIPLGPSGKLQPHEQHLTKGLIYSFLHSLEGSDSAAMVHVGD